MSHLGDRTSALIDGQLSAQETDRVLAHLAGCRACRDDVDAQRQMKAALTSLRGPEPEFDLMVRLISMGGQGPVPPREGRVPGTPAPAFAVSPRRPVTVAVQAPTRRPVGLPVPAGRPGFLRTASLRPAGRPERLTVVQPRRARLAGAVLGTIGVVGAGVSGFVLTTPAVQAGATGGRVSTPSFLSVGSGGAAYPAGAAPVSVNLLGGAPSQQARAATFLVAADDRARP